MCVCVNICIYKYTMPVNMCLDKRRAHALMYNMFFSFELLYVYMSLLSYLHQYTLLTIFLFFCSRTLSKEILNYHQPAVHETQQLCKG